MRSYEVQGRASYWWGWQPRGRLQMGAGSENIMGRGVFRKSRANVERPYSEHAPAVVGRLSRTGSEAPALTGRKLL